jgi:hypothetical protein
MKQEKFVSALVHYSLVFVLPVLYALSDNFFTTKHTKHTKMRLEWDSRRKQMMHIRLLNVLRVFTASCLVFCCGCSIEGGSTYQYVEVAPGKFLPVKFSSYITTDLVIKYEGKIVKYEGPAGVNAPEALMEYNKKLYVLALDASAQSLKECQERGPWRWRCFEQDGLGFKEIPAASYPRSIATINIWRPDGFQGKISRRFRRGTHGEKIDQLAFAKSFDTEDLYFADCEIAWLWYMLEVVNDFGAVTGGMGLSDMRYDSQDRTFIRNFKAKYKPVQLTTMELTPVPKEEIDF